MAKKYYVGIGCASLVALLMVCWIWSKTIIGGIITLILVVLALAGAAIPIQCEECGKGMGVPAFIWGFQERGRAVCRRCKNVKDKG